MRRNPHKITERSMCAGEFQEFLKCRQSPAYLIYHYCFLSHPLRGKLPFRLFRFQEIVINKFLQHAFTLILKSRQMGLSWLVAAYALWLALFFPDKKILMISIKDETAKSLLKKVRYMYYNLPDFLRMELVDDNMSRMSFANGSEIQSVPTSEEAGRSESLSLLIIDEAAFVRWIEQIWTAAYPTLSTGGQAIVLSTPNGIGNFFHEKWASSLEGRSLFYPIRLHWWYHPERDANWLKIQKMNMSEMQLAQEILGDFLMSGNLVFDAVGLRALQDTCSMIQPIETMYTEEFDPTFPCGLYLYDRPQPDRFYIISGDTARGGAGDYNACHVHEWETGKQVAEYRTKVPIELFNERFMKLGLEFNNALAAVENNNMGIATNLYLKANNYPRIYEHYDPLEPERLVDLGFPTNSMTRPLLINELETCIREGVSGVQGIRTVNEMMNFAWVRRGGSVKPEALSGKKDDLVMSYGIGRYVRKMAKTEVQTDFYVS